MLSGFEFDLFVVLGMTGFLLNLGYAVLGGLESLRQERKQRALVFAGAFLLWLLLSAGFVFFIFLQELAHSQFGGETVLLRLAVIGYPLLSVVYWLGQRKLRTAPPV